MTTQDYTIQLQSTDADRSQAEFAYWMAAIRQLTAMSFNKSHRRRLSFLYNSELLYIYFFS
jgi:deoxyribodipyrimidine photolyase-like uncharacterized protein